MTYNDNGIPKIKYKRNTLLNLDKNNFTVLIPIIKINN